MLTCPFRMIRRSMRLFCFTIMLFGMPSCDSSRSDVARFWERTPGIWLGGVPSEAPPDWSEANRYRVAKLATYSPLPYVVTIGYVGSGSDVYVMAVPDSVWLKRFREGHPVEMRIGESTYRLSGVEIRDPEEVRRALAVYSEKYQAWLDSYFGVALNAENLREFLIPIRFVSRP